MTTLLRNFSPIFDSPLVVAALALLCLLAILAMIYYVVTAVRADMASYRDEDSGQGRDLTSDELDDMQLDPWPARTSDYMDSRPARTSDYMDSWP